MTTFIRNGLSLKVIRKQGITKHLIFSFQVLLALLFLSQFNAAFAEKVTSNFDHYKTGFPIDGAHKKLKCSSCHKLGIFKGTPKTCNGCHGNRATIATSKKPTGHVRSTNSCDNCHVDKSWSNAQMDHNSITGSCVACHNGTIKNAKRKSKNHISSSDSCENCHSTRRWSPAKFFHTNISNQCVSCHNNPNATKTRGKTVNHVQSSNECETCHTNFKTWKGGKVDHNTVTIGCNSCHNGTTSGQKKSDNHILTSILCERCHSPTRKDWLGVRMEHSEVSSNCVSCHSASQTGAAKMQGKSNNHVKSSDQCSNCHTNFKTWKGAKFDHSATTVDCYSCHNGTTSGLQKSATHPITGNVCEDCHKTIASPTVSVWSSRITMGHDSTTDTCLRCHDGSTKGKSKSASHIQVGQAKCDLCHTSRKSWTGTGNVKMDHGAVNTANCVSCHTASRANAAKQKGKTTNHIISSNICSECHTSFSTWKGAKVDHGVITKGCESCHNGSTSGAKKGLNHILLQVNVCENCHGTNTNPTLSVWKTRQKMDHGSVSPNCVTCHSADRATAAKQLGKNVGHIQSSNDCIVCHSKGFTTWKGATIDHGLISTGCVSCHNGSTSGAQKGINHIPVLQNVCENCHSANANPILSDWRTKEKMDHGSVTDTCLTCHSADRANAAKQRGKHAAHIVSSNICQDCHKGFSTWKGATIDHSLISSGCFSCHNGTTSGRQKDSAHMVTLNVCEVCHDAGTAAKPADATWRTGMSYTHAPGFPSAHAQYQCKDCHVSNSQFDVGRGIGKSLSPDCAGCHAQKFNDNLNDHEPGDTYTDHSTCNARCHGNSPEHSTSSF